ncbi:MAG TPA: hypothetical protein VED59_06225, partial [Acidimicrobiales bacterium]|nr:hypothetical protein [Acidimicrobiales bacterium]
MSRLIVRGEEVAHRGISWRRSQSGRIAWYNEGLARWVRWHPGADAPPLPPDWGEALAQVGEASAAGGEAL